MAIDTRNKRHSAINVGLPYRGVLPNPDAAITAPDRLTVAFLYNGIAADTPPVVTGTPYMVLLLGVG